jgi:hypothetical protein
MEIDSKLAWMYWSKLPMVANEEHGIISYTSFPNTRKPKRRAFSEEIMLTVAVIFFGFITI